MRWYRALLHLYPRSFRHEYGGEMAAVFRRELAASGPAWRLVLCLSATVDVVKGAALTHLDILRRDLTSVWRQTRRAPGFAITAVLVIALGTGANSAVFAVADFVLFRPLAFPESSELVKLWERRPGYGAMELSPANYRDWAARTTSVEAMAGIARTAVNVTGHGEPFRAEGAGVTGRFFAVLGMSPALGRALTPADADPGAPRVVVLAHGLWRARFAGDPGVLGTTVRLDGEPHEVVGVMPPAFVYPTQAIAFWTAQAFDEDDYLDRNNNFLLAVARLRDEVTVADAQRDFDRIAAALEAEHPVENEQAGARVVPLRDAVSTRARVLLLALVAAATCVLLIAGANLANLMLARGLARRHELVVRAALGAGRDRLARQLATELLCLAAAGGVAGVAAAAATLPALARLVPDALPLTGAPAVDGRVVAMAGATMLALGLAAGLWPLMRAGGARGEALRDGPRGGLVRGERLRGTLVVVGIASSVVLLATAGLLFRTLATLQDRPPGFDADDVTVARTSLPMPAFEDTERRTAWLRDVTSALESVPGVTNAAYTSFAPMTMGGGIWPVELEPGDVRREAGQVASLRFVTPGYFDTLRIPVLDGRGVEWSDTADQPFVAVVSRSFADRFWPNERAVGRRFGFAFVQREVVGVVGDVSNRGPELESEPQVYLPAGQVPDGGLVFYTPQDLVVRAALPSGALEATIRRVIRERAPDLPVASVRPLAAIVTDQTASRAVQLQVIGAFAVVALLLAGLGIHGLLAFVVSQRRPEIGLRMALGADRRRVLRLVVGRTAWLVAAGLVPGLVLAALAGRGLAGVLVGVSPFDPASFAAAAGLCAAVAALGTVLPARRAAAVDPAIALRGE